MEHIRKQYKRELRNLDIGENDNITIRFVTIKFKRKALKVHSDKTGKDDEDFKELVQDFNTLLDALKDLAEEGECVEKSDLQKFFEKHNFAKEFSKTWTIFIEKEKINEWKNIMNKRFPGGYTKNQQPE